LENILSKYSLFFSGKKFAKFRPNFWNFSTYLKFDFSLIAYF
jgi:hypothetical protein